MKSKERNYIQSLCEEYIPARRELPIVEADLEKLRAKAGQAKTPSEKRVFEFGIRIREEALKFAQDVISEYEHLVKGLDDEERMVITQLYSEGKTWDQIKDTQGKTYPRGTLSRARNRAMKNMADRKASLKNLRG